MTETSDSGIVSTRQQRIAQLAKQMPEKGLTSLNQHLDLAWLREAYRRTRKDGAVGIDGQTAAEYEKDLEGNLRSLLELRQVGHVLSAAGATGLYPEGHWRRDPPHRHSDPGG